MTPSTAFSFAPPLFLSLFFARNLNSRKFMYGRIKKCRSKISVLRFSHSATLKIFPSIFVKGSLDFSIIFLYDMNDWLKFFSREIKEEKKLKKRELENNNSLSFDFYISRFQTFTLLLRKIFKHGRTSNTSFLSKIHAERNIVCFCILNLCISYKKLSVLSTNNTKSKLIIFMII